MDFSSKIFENAVNQVAQLPGIGKKSAVRMVLHLLKQSDNQTKLLGEAISQLHDKIQYCTNCHNISDTPICNICSNTSRDHNTICVVEDIRDVMAIENTGQFNGIYHVLGGKISPIDGIGPTQLNINSLVQKAESQNIKEIIFALSATMEGETTNFYIFKKLQSYNIQFSNIARGIAIGNDLEYTDEITLGRSIINRIPFENTLKKS